MGKASQDAGVAFILAHLSLADNDLGGQPCIRMRFVEKYKVDFGVDI
jgi:hypothetical protein